jgi:formylglycine-generating enzyme required for sulfatase activity
MTVLTASTFFSIVRTGCCALALALLALAPAHANRLALVIGNSAYTDGPLKNPVNDARAMDQKLATLGFKVQRVENLKRTQIGRTITAFANTVRAGDDVVVFYAGHGVQVKGINYLPAVDADIQSEEDVPLNSLNLNNLMERLDEAKAGLKILFLDACRNNPYARSFRSGDRGLARVGAAPSGTLIHFATRPGSVAADGGGANGLYTSELLRHMDSPNVSIEAMLKRVSAAVETASKGAQEPWTEGSIRGEFYFKAGAGVQLASVSAEPTGRPVQSDPEEETWQAAKAANTAAAFEAYLGEYPRGRYASAARIARGSAQGQSAAQPTPAQQRPASTSSFTAGQVIQDCSDCPQMVVIPAGSFTMGSSAQEQALANAVGMPATQTSRESPQHSVSIKSFAAGKYAVTKGEFAKFVNAKGYQTKAEQGDGCFGWIGTEWKKDKAYSWRNAGFAQGDDHPVVCVSWNDAQAYAQWVSQTSGKPYRLLSEAEREYAARGNTQTAFWWGKSISTSQANYDGNYSYNGSAKGTYHQATVPVSSFGANPFGLYNVHGNVWEWTEDCFHDNYSGAPSDGSAWTTGCSITARVLRNGSWNDYPVILRSANRDRESPDGRNHLLGFRLARTLFTP